MKLRGSIAFISVMLLTTIAQAQVDFVTVRECRSMFFGKLSEEAAQDKLNTSLRDELRKRKPKAIYHITYGNTESFMRSKENACMVATAWIEVD